MSHQTKRQSNQAVNSVRDPITEYLVALEKIYPAAIGTAEVIKRRDNRVIVTVPLPADEDERILLYDQMAEVGTKILIETDEYIILSSQ